MSSDRSGAGIDVVFVDTVAASINRHPLNLRVVKYIYVNANTGNDTANLYEGRGSEALPFKTLNAAVTFALSCYSGTQDINIICETDCTFNGNFLASHVPYLFITSKDESNPVTITFTSNIGVSHGNIRFHKVHLDLGSYRIGIYGETQHAYLWLSSNTITCNGGHISLAGPGANLLFGACVFHGTADNDGVLHVTNNSVCKIANDLSGDITGKRYTVNYGATLNTFGRGVNAVPGTIAGVVASNAYLL